MKFALLLCFLIAFVNSKFPTQSFNSLLENSSDEDNLKCIAASESKDICVDVKLDNQNNQCCYLDAAFLNQTQKVCYPLPKNIGDFTKIINFKQFKPLTKEVFGFIKYSFPEALPIADIPDVKAQVICKDGIELDVDIGGDEYKYTQDEIKILKSEDYCLNYTMSAITQKDQKFKKFDCKNGKLLPSSKEAGIECGDLSVSFKVGTNETNLKTCLLFSYDMFSNIKIPDEYKGEIQKKMKEMFEDEGKVTIELSDSKGRKVTFDSDTGEIISNPNNPNNHSSILNISKYLFLLTLFLF